MKKHLLLTVAVWVCAMAAADLVTPIYAEDLRVLTFNIQHGAAGLQQVAHVINESKPDLVVLQEVDNKTRRSRGVDQASELARLTGMHFAFGKAMDFGGGEYGVAVLSRYPILEKKTHPLRARPGFEPRAALEARVRIGKKEIVLLGVHLAHEANPVDRNAQARQLIELAVKSPAILAGDFNALPDSDAYRIIRQRWDDATNPDEPTWPADNPKQKSDYIFFQGFRVVEAHVLDERAASDHRPVLAVLEFNDDLNVWTPDNGNGTYKNPVFWGDWPDADVLRVGDEFYFISTSMHYVPGCPFAKSKDLVNWEMAGYAVSRYDEDPGYDMKDGTLYVHGSWTNTIRHRNGKCYVGFQVNNPGNNIPWTANRFALLDFSTKDARAIAP